MTYKIEKGIPAPANQRKGHKWETFPFKDLEVGDSFVIPTKEIISKNSIGKICAAAARKTKKNFVYAEIKTGIRIWRV